MKKNDCKPGSYLNPINKVPIDDCAFFADIRLSSVNVYQFTVYSPEIDDLVADILFRMREFSTFQLLQEIGCDYAKFTFVSHIDCRNYYKIFDITLNLVKKIHNCEHCDVI